MGSQVCTREGYLMKQTSSFQRWRRRYFKLKGRTLYYAKDTKVTNGFFNATLQIKWKHFLFAYEL